jgi:hypothetical protein
VGGRWRKLGEERVYLGGRQLQHVWVVLLYPLQHPAGDLLQRGSLRDPGDLQHLGDRQVLDPASPSLRLDAERPNRTARAACVQTYEAGSLRDRREPAELISVWIYDCLGHSRRLARQILDGVLLPAPSVQLRR